MKKTNKGFTLVELIVVLVILAILAAILVPALLGYIDNAMSKQTVLNARTAMIAAQAEMSSIYGTKSGLPSEITNDTHVGNIKNTADFTSLAWTEFSVGCKTTWTEKVAEKKDHHEAFTIVYVKYTDATGTVYFDGEQWSETAPATTGLKVHTITSGT